MIVIRPITLDEWATLRNVRLRALSDSPMAFGSTYARETAWTDEEWRCRVRERSMLGRSVTLLAMDGDRCCGIAGCNRDSHRPEEALVVSMWVAPESRRRGLATRLLKGIESWALDHGIIRLTLDVTEKNQVALATYQRCGFVLTGKTLPYPNAPDIRELCMIKNLARENADLMEKALRP